MALMGRLLTVLLLLLSSASAQVGIQIGGRNPWPEYVNPVRAKIFELVLDSVPEGRTYAIGIEPSDRDSVVAGGTLEVSSINSVTLQPGVRHAPLPKSRFEVSGARVRVKAADVRGSVGIYLRVRRDSVVQVIVNGKPIAQSQAGKSLMVKDGTVIDHPVRGSGSVLTQIRPPARCRTAVNRR